MLATPCRRRLLLAAALAPLVSPLPAEGQDARAVAGWDAYVAAVERRVDGELASAGGPFLVLETLGPKNAAGDKARLRRGEVVVHELHRPPGAPEDVQHAMVHHWLGAILVPGASVDQVIAFVQDYDHHAASYTDVMASRTISRDGDRFRVFLKLQRSRFKVTAHYNTEHDVVYRRHDESRASSRSRTTRIAELDNAGKPQEREKSADEDRDYLWRLNSYWRFQSTPEGVIVECESVSLSRGIPWGFGFLVGPFVKSVPRDSLERTLQDMRAGVVARTRAAR